MDLEKEKKEMRGYVQRDRPNLTRVTEQQKK